MNEVVKPSATSPFVFSISKNKRQHHEEIVRFPSSGFLIRVYTGSGIFRYLKFTTYSRSKAALVEICKKIGGNKKTLVGFGDFSNQHGLVKRRPTAPIKRWKGQLHQYCKVVEIDECCKSHTCSSCYDRVELYRNYIRREKKGVLEPTARMSKVFSVIRCKNNECNLCLMDRDINAARNILTLLLSQRRGEERPTCFSRRRH